MHNATMPGRPFPRQRFSGRGSTIVALLAVVLGLGWHAGTVAGSDAEARSIRDQPDQYLDRYQVHVIYALPKGETDRRLDVNGAIEGSLGSLNQFLSEKIGRKLRIDRRMDGAFDISFIALPASTKEYEERRHDLLYEVRRDIVKAGFNDPRKVYLIFLESFTPHACGEAPMPGGGEAMGFVYTKTCRMGDTRIFSAGAHVLALHELLHAIGHVRGESCDGEVSAERAHVRDQENDLMSPATTSRKELTFDVEGKYYRATGQPCDIENSALLIGGGNYIHPWLNRYRYRDPSKVVIVP